MCENLSYYTIVRMQIYLQKCTDVYIHLRDFFDVRTQTNMYIDQTVVYCGYSNSVSLGVVSRFF